MKLNFITGIASENQAIKEVKILTKKNKCEYCEKEPTHYLITVKNNLIIFDHKKNILFYIDHIIPKLKGGSEFLDNLTLICESCKNIKRDNIIYIENKPRMRLFYLQKEYIGTKENIPKNSLVCAVNIDLNNVTVYYNKKRFLMPIEYIGKEIAKKRLK